MGTILTIVLLTIFGLLLRGLFKDKSIADKPKDTYSWIVQFIISLLVGAFIWYMIIPSSCKRSSDNDPADRIIKSHL